MFHMAERPKSDGGIILYPDRPDIADWFKGTLYGEEGKYEVISRAINGQIEFNNALLPSAENPSDGLEIREKGDVRCYRRRRDFGYYDPYSGKRVPTEQISANLYIKRSDLTQKHIIPTAFNQQTKAILRIGGNSAEIGAFAQYSHSYEDGSHGIGSFEPERRLFQEVKVGNMTDNYCPILRSVSIQRIARDDMGDMVFGQTLLQDKGLINSLGFQNEGNDPVSLVFLPDRIFAMTYWGNKVLGEMFYSSLNKIGIRAHFTNTNTEATFGIGAGDRGFGLKLDKVLKPDYAQLLLTPNDNPLQGWITHSQVCFRKFSEVSLN